MVVATVELASTTPTEDTQKLMCRLGTILTRIPLILVDARKIKLMRHLRPGIRGRYPIDLDPLDPFEYDQSGQKAFPAMMSLDGSYHRTLKAQLWPPIPAPPAASGAGTADRASILSNHG
jgi:hypothetical protein